nr:response regulator [uncultured Rhodoferax sp.]
MAPNAGPRTVLVVEDEDDIAGVMLDYLRFNGYAAERLSDGLEAIAHITRQAPDLLLLDVMLPGCDGFEVLRAIRRFTALPTIMLTARVEEVDRLLGLDCGADDYICKPFSPREVVARVRAVLRRSVVAHGETATAVPPLTLDHVRRRASLHGQPLHLTGKEFDILKTLQSSPGRVYSRTQLLELAYPGELDANERAVDSHVKNLRRKFALVDPQHEWFRSVYGVGFALEDPLAPDEGAQTLS